MIALFFYQGYHTGITYIIDGVVKTLQLLRFYEIIIIISILFQPIETLADGSSLQIGRAHV